MRKVIAFLMIAAFLMQSVFSNMVIPVSATQYTPGMSGETPSAPNPLEPSTEEEVVPPILALQLFPVGQSSFNYTSAAGPVVEVCIYEPALHTRTESSTTGENGEVQYDYTPVDEANLENAITVTCKDSVGVDVVATVVNASYVDGEYRAGIQLPADSVDGVYGFTVNAYNATGPVAGAPATASVLIDSQAPVISDVILATGLTVEGLEYPVYNAQTLPTVTFHITENNLEALAVHIVDANNLPITTLDLTNGVTYDASTQTYSFMIPEGERLGFSIQAIDTVNQEAVYFYSGTKVIVDYTDAVMSDIIISQANVLNDIYYVLDNSKITFSITDACYLKNSMWVRIFNEQHELISNVDFAKLTETVEGDTHRFSTVVDLPTKGTYYYRVDYSDISKIGSAEQQTGKNSALMRRDMSLPTLSIEPSIANNTIATENVTIKILLHETNPDFSAIRGSLYAATNTKTLDGACKLVVGEKVVTCDNSKALDTRLQDASNWIETDTGYYTTLLLDTEADYSFSLLAADVMGNASNRINYFVTLDKSAPSFSSVDIDAAYDKDKTDYTRFSNKKITFTFEFKEKITTVTQVACVYVDSDTNVAYTVQASDMKQTKDKVTGSVAISNNFRGNVRLIAKDKAGHETSYTIKGSMILEGKKKHIDASEATITVLGAKNAEGFYNKDLYMNLQVSDTYSGLKKVTYAINDDVFSENIEGQELQYKWNKNRVKIAADKYEGKDIIVTLELEDNAGNITKVKETVRLDATKPKIQVSYDNNNSRNESYYNQPRTATITIKEYHFSNKDVELIATKNGEKITLKPDFELVKKEYSEDGLLYKDYRMEVPFAEDGDYTFTVAYTDLAGNKADYDSVNAFTVDQTSPVVELTFNHNESAAGKLFKDGRTGTITVTEHNFNPASMKIEVHRTLNGVASSAPAVTNFRSAGDKHATSIAFSEEGVYTISVTGSDLAGNEGNSIEEQQFTVDITAPEVKIEGLEAGSSYTGDVSPVVTVTDNNYDSEGVNIALKAGKNKNKEVTYETAPAVRGEVFRLEAFDYEKASDDIYDLSVTARDLAGHETVENVGFKINRHGSYYIVPDTSKQMLDHYYISGDSDFEIFEYNVDGIQEHNVYYSLNGEITQLVNGLDYTVQEEIDRDTEWSKYTYKIFSSVFVQEGIYLLSIASKDESGHVTDNKVNGLELEFCVDRTAPSCVVTGIDDNHDFEKDATRFITVDVFDNIELDYLEMFIDNESVRRVEASDLNDGKLTYTIPKDGGSHVLQILCYDTAGNRSSIKYNYHVDGGVSSQQTLLIIGGFLAIVIMVILVFILRKNRRQKE